LIKSNQNSLGICESSVGEKEIRETSLGQRAGITEDGGSSSWESAKVYREIPGEKEN
jgi:hypothetical protein